MSLPSALDRNIPSVLSLRAVVALDEQHYKNDACVSDEHEFVFGASDACEDVRAYEDDELYVLPQHLAALPIAML